jgi:hypothetical protein
MVIRIVPYLSRPLAISCQALNFRFQSDYRYCDEKAFRVYIHPCRILESDFQRQRGP